MPRWRVTVNDELLEFTLRSIIDKPLGWRLISLSLTVNSKLRGSAPFG